jgi:hypothetical protein
MHERHNKRKDRIKKKEWGNIRRRGLLMRKEVGSKLNLFTFSLGDYDGCVAGCASSDPGLLFP